MFKAAGYDLDVRRSPIWDLPLRKVIALVWLEGIEQITEAFQVSEQERAFGNYWPGRYAWKFGTVYRLKEPIVATGRLGVWQWAPPASLWTEIQEQLDLLQEGPSQ